MRLLQLELVRVGGIAREAKRAVRMSVVHTDLLAASWKVST
jgi:hypothetical protein